MTPRTESRCETCGLLDDHPKLHYGERTFHHDCLPYPVKQDVIDHADWHPQPAAVAQIVKFCEDGERGDALLTHIQEFQRDVVAPALEEFHTVIDGIAGNADPNVDVTLEEVKAALDAHTDDPSTGDAYATLIGGVQ